ncbi:50S ribosomal protein L17 [Candidatus Parcubacteria bacterium]|nr:MAG: 50S ribosomal protein L17 [Candidatus Parcubacteria bacterium]
MRHRKEGKKFNRLQGERRAFLRNLVNNLIRLGRIETTEVRAKAIRPFAERLVTVAKRQTLGSRRLLFGRTHDRVVTQKLYGELGPRYSDRKGGYTRIIKLGKTRKRDGSRLATIEFV